MLAIVYQLSYDSMVHHLVFHGLHPCFCLFNGWIPQKEIRSLSTTKAKPSFNQLFPIWKYLQVIPDVPYLHPISSHEKKIHHHFSGALLILLQEGMSWRQSFLQGETKLCNFCRSEIQRHETRWRCFHHCDFNVCEKCYREKAAQWSGKNPGMWQRVCPFCRDTVYDKDL